MKLIFKIVGIILVLAIVITIICFVLISPKESIKEENEDPKYIAEMEELKNRLDTNLKLIEEKNTEYANIMAVQQNEWNNTLADLEDEESKVSEMVINLPVVGIGDSVLLGAQSALYNQFPNGYFDGKVSRTISGGEDVINSLKSQGKLGDILILALANNGDYSTRKNQELMELVGDGQVYWIDAKGADDPNFNSRFRDFATNYPNLHIVEWEAIANSHPEYIYGDGVHLREGTATRAYAHAVYEAIYNDYLENYRIQKEEIIQQHEEEEKKKIVFYGNDLLVNAFDCLYEKFPNAFYNAKLDYDFETLYNELQEKINNNSLEHRIVFIFDDISYENCQKLVDLCQNNEIYIINISKEKFSFENENIKLIDFYDEIKNNKDYLISDKKHFSKNGNIALSDIIFRNVENIETVENVIENIEEIVGDT